MSLSKKEIVVQIIDDAFALALTSTSQDFAWELFWQVGIDAKLYDYNFNLMYSAMNSKNDANFNINDIIDTKSPDIMDAIRERKAILMAEHSIKLVPFSEYQSLIVSFFKEHRNIDFNSVDDAEGVSLLRDEDITDSDDMICSALNMTRMQFKYLYQKGAVYLAV